MCRAKKSSINFHCLPWKDHLSSYANSRGRRMEETWTQRSNSKGVSLTWNTLKFISHWRTQVSLYIKSQPTQQVKHEQFLFTSFIVYKTPLYLPGTEQSICPTKKWTEKLALRVDLMLGMWGASINPYHHKESSSAEITETHPHYTNAISPHAYVKRVI